MRTDTTLSSTTMRNSLALTRTSLANERTVLSYVRTSLTLIVTGGGVLKFLQDGVTILLVGWGLISLGVVLFLLGFNRFYRVSNSLKKHLF